jgi:hypothetical protein
MNEKKKRVLITEIVPPEKLRDLIKKVWGKVMTSKSSTGNVKTTAPTSITDPELEQPELFPPTTKTKKIRGIHKQTELPIDVPVKKVSKTSTPQSRQRTGLFSILNNIVEYTDKYEWIKDNYKEIGKPLRGRDRLDYFKRKEARAKYIGPDLTEWYNIPFDMFTPGNIVASLSDHFIMKADKYMKIWNKGMRRKSAAAAYDIYRAAKAKEKANQKK